MPDAIEAYVYGYPLVTMEMTRRVMTNVDKPTGSHAPMGQFLRMREYPGAAFRDVTAPNADTLYTTAWLDVGHEPWVLSLPDAHDRYFGEGSGETFFMGAYLDTLPDAVIKAVEKSGEAAGPAQVLEAK